MYVCVCIYIYDMIYIYIYIYIYNLRESFALRSAGESRSPPSDVVLRKFNAI